MSEFKVTHHSRIAEIKEKILMCITNVSPYQSYDVLSIFDSPLRRVLDIVKHRKVCIYEVTKGNNLVFIAPLKQNRGGIRY